MLRPGRMTVCNRAGAARTVDHHDAAAGTRQMGRSGESIRTRADDRRIVPHVYQSCRTRRIAPHKHREGNGTGTMLSRFG